MNLETICNAVDHTLLRQTATWKEIQTLCDEGMRYHVASVCIPACYVRPAADYVGEKLPVCTVIGFPNGYSTTAAKCFEAADAVQNGAREIDMVVNLGLVRSGEWNRVQDEINRVKEACADNILKVIIETCLLTTEEKIELCHVVSASGADFIKTSTGFSTDGATREDIVLFRQHCDPSLKIKAAGGIRTLEDAQEFLDLGADRLGTSAVVRLCGSAEQ